MAIGVNYRGKDDGPYETPEQVDELLDQLRASTIETGDGMIAMVYRPSDEEWTGPLLEIGINAEKGYVTWWDGKGNRAVSYGGDLDGYVDYFNQGNHSEKEARHEIDYGTVKQAVKEFLASDGGKPGSVPWED